MHRRSQDVVFALLVSASLGLAVLGVLVTTGHFVNSDTEATQARPAATNALPSRPPPAPEPPATRGQVSQRRPAAAKQQVLSVLITASRGDCWVAAHRGSATGPILAERVLVEGSTMSLKASRVVLELGAAGNVDVSVNGAPRQIPTGTTQIVLQ